MFEGNGLNVDRIGDMIRGLGEPVKVAGAMSKPMSKPMPLKVHGASRRTKIFILSAIPLAIIAVTFNFFLSLYSKSAFTLNKSRLFTAVSPHLSIISNRISLRNATLHSKSKAAIDKSAIPSAILSAIALHGIVSIYILLSLLYTKLTAITNKSQLFSLIFKRADKFTDSIPLTGDSKSRYNLHITEQSRNLLYSYKEDIKQF